jgi:uncharacterized protein YqiB (DUF1249 family)
MSIPTVIEHAEKRSTASVDLAGHIETCELNYFRLLALLPGLREGSRSWGLIAGETEQIDISITLKESAPYTSVVDIEQQHAEMRLPSMSVRLSHDAGVAEIITFDGHRHWLPVYDYPNPEMYQPDEKCSLNRFLGDWLVFCRKHGMAKMDKCDSVLVCKSSDIHK